MGLGCGGETQVSVMGEGSEARGHTRKAQC